VISWGKRSSREKSELHGKKKRLRLERSQEHEVGGKFLGGEDLEKYHAQ